MNNRGRKEEGKVFLTSTGLALRRRAEEVAWEKRDRPFKEPGEMSLEEMREKLHELLVHQIELEMQNDELRLAQMELEDAKARYLDLYDMAPVGYYTISEKGIITEANLTAANMLGVARGTLIMKPISRFIFEEDQDIYYFHKLKIFETGEPQSCELRMKGKDGAVFWAHLSAVAQRDADGVWICRVALSDITERKLKDGELVRTKEALEQTKQQALDLVEELKKADGQKDNFLSALSHELRNPMAAISAGLQLLDITQDVCQAERAKEIMKRQMHQLCRLADDLLDLTRITRNKIEIKKEKIELKTLMELVAEDHKTIFDEKGIELDVEVTGGSLYLDADPVRIRQSIGNLLYNAMKFSYTGGKVLLRLTKEKNEALISVKDEGRGIKPEFIPSLFQPFMQEDHSIDRSGGGLGLGLPIVKGIVELHGGSVSVFSEGPGKGSQFTIRLPIIKTAEKKKSNKDFKDETSRSLRILLIEDNHDLVEMLRTMIQLMGHTVATAYNGMEGIEKAKEFSPEVVFCDIGMPGMDGIETARRIRNETSLKDLFLVALTGYAEQRNVELAIKSGFNRHLAKPVDRDTLEKILADVP